MKPVYGLTHKETGEPLIRQVTTTKCGIGLPQGKQVHVYIDQESRWVVLKNKEKIVCKEGRREAQEMYAEALKTAEDRKYPQRLSYFTFTKVSADGGYRPDFDAIELHGPVPVEVPIIFLKDEPFDVEYAYFTQLEKKCWGDGKDATRVITCINPEGSEFREQQVMLASRAKDAGERFYKIEDQCWTCGCPFAQPNGDKPSPCRPHGRLFFQLLKAPRLGATAYFDTTGRRSIQQLFSCLEDFKSFTGQGDSEKGFVAGIPMFLTVRPYRARYESQGKQKTSTQYGVALEFRTKDPRDAERLVQTLVSKGVDYRIASTAPLALLEGQTGHEESIDTTFEEERPDAATIEAEGQESIIPESPAAIATEYYPENGGSGDEEDNLLDPVVGEPIVEPTRKSAKATSETEAAAQDVASEIHEKHEKHRARIRDLAEVLVDHYGCNGKTIAEIIEIEGGTKTVGKIPVEKLAVVVARLEVEVLNAKTKGKR